MDRKLPIKLLSTDFDGTLFAEFEDPPIPLELQQLNSDLARKNQELDAMVQTSPDIIFSRHADGARDYVSSRFYEYTGAPTGSAIGFRRTCCPYSTSAAILVATRVHPRPTLRWCRSWCGQA